MRVITLLAAAALASFVGVTPANAWHLEGCVLCAAGDPVPIAGIKVVVQIVGGQRDGEVFMALTDEEGCYFVPLPEEDQDYKAYLADLPPSTKVIFPPGGVRYFRLDWKNIWEDFNFVTDGPECGSCWLTGGGVKFDSVIGGPSGQAGPRNSFGGNVFPSCGTEPGNGGNVNVVLHSDKLHLQNTDIDSVRCGNVPGIPPGTGSPSGPFNFIEWMGTGSIVGIKGNKLAKTPVYVFGRAEDRNEPGNQNAASGEDIDRLFIRAYTNPLNPVGSTVALVDANGGGAEVDPMLITGGNLQLHFSSCDDPPSPFPQF